MENFNNRGGEGRVWADYNHANGQGGLGDFIYQIAFMDWTDRGRHKWHDLILCGLLQGL